MPVPPRSFFCADCREERARQSSARYREGMALAPGEVSVSRRDCYCGLSELAKLFGVTRSRAQQIERIALLKLRRALMPYLQEHDPGLHEKLLRRETASQQWLATTASSRPPGRELPARYKQELREMRELAELYEQDGQPEIAGEIRAEIADLVERVEAILGQPVPEISFTEPPPANDLPATSPN